MGQRAIGGEPAVATCANPRQVAIALLTDHEGAPGGQEVGIELASITATVDHPDTAAIAGLGTAAIAAFSSAFSLTKSGAACE